MPRLTAPSRTGGDHKLIVNIQRFADVNGAIQAFRRIVQLHIRRVPGTALFQPLKDSGPRRPASQP